MAGGTISRVSLGSSIKEIEENYTIHTEYFTMNSGGKGFFSSDKEVLIANPKKPKPVGKYFKRGWWTDENDNPIKEALIGQTVKFHVEMEKSKVPAGSKIDFTLKDWDGMFNEDDSIKIYSTQKDPKTNTYPEVNQFTTDANGKASISINLTEGLVKMINDDGGNEIELYFACTYYDKSDKEIEQLDLPAEEFNYLIVYEKEVLITVIVELPMKNYDYSRMGIGEQVVAKAGLLGHTAIGIDKEYYDYGPEQDSSILKGSISESRYGDLNNDGDTIDSYNGIDDSALKSSGLNQGEYGNPMGTLGSPWWDKAFTSNGNANLADIMTILKDDNLRKQYGILGEVHIFEVEVKESQAKTLKQWWENKYNNNLGIYSVNIMENGEHCTSTVHDSLVEAKIIKSMPYGSICTPKSFLNHLRYIMVSNTAGNKKGEKAKQTILKDLS